MSVVVRRRLLPFSGMATRTQLFTHFGIIGQAPDLDGITKDAYEELEEKIWRNNLNSSPHGRPWFTSFHASAFPDRDKPCGRLALYTMLDIPRPEPSPPLLVATGDIGKAVEYQIVYRWGLKGITIGGSVPLWDGAHMSQVKFEDDDTWLTGSSDAILDLREWSIPYVVPVDVKSKNHDVVQEMQLGRKSYENKHYLQLQAYLYLCNIFHTDMGWGEMGLQPAEGGYIYYASRQNPRTAHAFFCPIDWELIERGRNLLREWREDFISDNLPERPREWRWTEEPCKWCPMKKYACKPDNKEKITRLTDSNAVTFAKELRPKYDYNEIKEEVIKRWDR